MPNYREALKRLFEYYSGETVLSDDERRSCEGELRREGIGIVSREEAETCDLVVCVSGQNFFFADNVFTVCSQCGGCIQHRPFAPQKPPKVCLRCAKKMVATEKPNVQS